MSPTAAVKDRLADYVDVKERIRLFLAAYPDGRLQTHSIQLTSEPDGVPRVIVEARAYRNRDDTLPGHGHSWMVLPGATSFTRGSELENTETSAWGRAIGALGIGLDHGIASKDEITAKEGEAERPAPAPPPDPAHDGLIGEVTKAGNHQYELRQTPTGWRLSFRLKQGRPPGVIVFALDDLAQQLQALEDEIVGQRAQVWGSWVDRAMDKDGREVQWSELQASRVKVGEYDLPEFSGAESAAIDAAMAEAPKRPGLKLAADFPEMTKP